MIYNFVRFHPGIFYLGDSVLDIKKKFWLIWVFKKNLCCIIIHTKFIT